MSEYTCEQIHVLTGLAPVRKRPGMYIGDTTNKEGLHHMLWTVVDIVLDEHLAGFSSELRVELGPDTWITIHDDGMGLPTDALPDRGEQEPTNALELVFTSLHGGGRQRYGHTRITSALHGVGVAVVNALSEELVVETTYQGVRWSLAFARGERVVGLRRLGPTKLAGTTVRFRPDPTIFTDTAVDHDHVRRRLRDLARLYPHLRVWFQEQRLEGRGGIAEWARRLASKRGEVVERFSSAQTIGNTHVEIAFAWNPSGKPLVRSFVNASPTVSGSHHDGMWSGFCEYARSTNTPARGNSHFREAIGCGLVAVIHVTTDDVRFTSQRRDELRSPSVTDAVRAAVLACLNGGGLWGQRRFIDERLLVDRTRC